MNMIFKEEFFKDWLLFWKKSILKEWDQRLQQTQGEGTPWALCDQEPLPLDTLCSEDSEEFFNQATFMLEHIEKTLKLIKKNGFSLSFLECFFRTIENEHSFYFIGKAFDKKKYGRNCSWHPARNLLP